MTKTFLKIYDYLTKHIGLTIILLICFLALCLVASTRLGYREDATEFLPQNPENKRYQSVYDNMGGQDRITLIFHTDGTDESHYEIIEAVNHFEKIWQTAGSNDTAAVNAQFTVDESLIVDAMDYVRQNIGCYLTAEDYIRIDSLLSDPTHIETSVKNVKQMLSFPMGTIAEDAITNDPLNLFTPALQRLGGLSATDHFEVDEQILFDPKGNALAFIDSPWGGNDTRNNAKLAQRIDTVISKTMELHPTVAITAVGAPLIAVTNATQIKQDSVFAIILSIIFIAAILLVAIRQKRNIVLLGLSVLAGWLFALALIALFKPTISIIVIGIGSVLVGIAVNYPLHFIDFIGEKRNSREALKEMVEPLITGNITTVSAFACLAFVKAEAMRDLGVFGALMLIGTILFVMIFLPLLAKAQTKKRQTEADGPMEKATASTKQKMATWLLLPVIAATIYLGIRSTHTQFDSNLHNINYMTEQQKSDLALLTSSIDDTANTIEYLVSEGRTLDEAIDRNASLLHTDIAAYPVSGINGIIPSISQQQANIKGWETFREKYPDLSTQLKEASLRQGFASEAFDKFYSHLDRNYNPIDPSKMGVLLQLATNNIIQSDSGYSTISILTVPKHRSKDIKTSLRTTIEDNHTFIFDIEDVGINLVETLQSDFNYILFVCSIVVFVFLWLSFGRIELAVLSFLPMAVGWLWILGIMDMTAVKFNIVNIILATFIFGQGDDYTIFITEGLIFENAYGHRRLKSYRRSVILSALLMFVGIGTLIFAKHPAMRTLAEVVIIGMITVVGMACYLPPLIFRWMVHHHGRRREIPITLPQLAKTIFILIVFFIAAFVVITPYTILYRMIGKDSERKRARFHVMIQRFAQIAVGHLPGVTFDYQNARGEDFGRPAVIVANHQSHLDLLCMLQMHPKLVILTNDWVWRNPIYALIIRYAEYYPVSEGYDNILPRLKSLRNRGYSILIFPEGTRTADGKIGRFHKGAFQLAQQLGMDILPIFIHGAREVMPKEDIVLRPGKVTVEIAERIAAEIFSNTDSKTLTLNIRRYYEEHYEELRRRIEDEHYWLPYVRYQYIYKGRDVVSRAKEAINRYLSTGEHTLGQGEIALLKALANRDIEYHYTFDDEDDYLVATNCALRPDNLHYAMTER